MALGYLNLSNNAISLEGLRPLARAYILELCLGSNRSERRRIVRLLPNVWVLDEEYVTADERRFANEFDQSQPAGASEGGNPLYALNDEGCSKLDTETREDNRGEGNEPRISSGKDKPDVQEKRDYGCRLEYQDLELRGRQTREFFQNVVWNVPSRWVVRTAKNLTCYCTQPSNNQWFAARSKQP